MSSENPMISFTRQIGRHDCGIACLTMVASYFSVAFNYNEIRALLMSHVGENGQYSLKSIVDVASFVGLKPLASRVLCTSLFSSEMLAFTPYILYMNYKHFVVVVGGSKERIEVADPAFGMRTFSLSDIQFLRTKKLAGDADYAAIIAFTDCRGK